MAKERAEILTNLPGHLFPKMHRNISRHALMLLKKQYLLAVHSSNLVACTCYHTRVHDIPCVDLICTYINTNKAIEISEFAKQ